MFLNSKNEETNPYLLIFRTTWKFKSTYLSSYCTKNIHPGTKLKVLPSATQWTWFGYFFYHIDSSFGGKFKTILNGFLNFLVISGCRSFVAQIGNTITMGPQSTCFKVHSYQVFGLNIRRLFRYEFFMKNVSFPIFRLSTIFLIFFFWQPDRVQRELHRICMFGYFFESFFGVFHDF